MEAIIWLLTPLAVTVLVAVVLSLRSLRFRTVTQRRARRRSQLRRIESVLQPAQNGSVPPGGTEESSGHPADSPGRPKALPDPPKETVLEDSD